MPYVVKYKRRSNFKFWVIKKETGEVVRKLKRRYQAKSIAELLNGDTDDAEEIQSVCKEWGESED